MEQITPTRLWLVMMKAHHAVSNFAERSMVSKGLCLSDFVVLEMLLHKGPMPMSLIAEKARLANASTTAAIDRLEKKDLVRRTFNSNDRRMRVVELTDEGKNLIAGTFAEHERDIDALMKDIPAEERLALYQGLKKLGKLAEEAGNPEGEKDHVDHS